MSFRALLRDDSADDQRSLSHLAIRMSARLLNLTQLDGSFATYVLLKVPICLSAGSHLNQHY